MDESNIIPLKQPIEKLSLPHIGERGKVISSIENLETIIRALNITIRYNVINKEEEILIPGQSFSIDNRQNASLAWIMSVCSRLQMPIGQISDYLNYIADKNQFNPVITWVTSKSWDKKPRLEEFYSTVTAKNENDPKVLELKKTMIRKWMISAIAAAFKPAGASIHGVLVFQGNQDIGKTSWFKKLIPEELGLLADGKQINPSDKDSVLQAVKFWLIELGELDATFKKSDIAQLKAFLTRDKDLLRRAYARKESDYARRTVFFASVNPEKFLFDETGNRRFWTIACDKVNYSHQLDMQQVWAELNENHYQKGEQWFLTKEEMDQLNESNSTFESKDPLEERCEVDFDWASGEIQWQWLTATQILAELGIGNPKPSDCRTVSKVMKRLNKDKQKKSHGIFKLLCPPRVITEGRYATPFKK